MVLKTLVLLFIVHMIVYSFVVAVSATRTRSKVLLVLFAVLFPAASGFILYYFKGSREDNVVTDTPNS
ncbi:TPA: 6-phosphofructokinase [Vibrio parahaemolyticus]|uniref:6-phosphofructokinase n=1 Tax=Vibrio parahaemolyticus TaxID=670 RepID=UPI001A8F8CD5|nr:6-phosphofructokinase [Vibrio parahaemolyticus]MBO0235903.1 6-phosphofructokinase [Vibrio parahaemolyticus]HCG5595516.1 6-phosphofructokinase [Vibrio parahaemolyticus]